VASTSPSVANLISDHGKPLQVGADWAGETAGALLGWRHLPIGELNWPAARKKGCKQRYSPRSLNNLTMSDLPGWARNARSGSRTSLAQSVAHGTAQTYFVVDERKI